MIHPATELRFCGSEIGYGIFATEPIPAGTLTYVRDALEIQIPVDAPILTHPAYGPVIRKYSYTDPDGTRVLSWDLAKYVNHCCDANCLSTGWGFEIAVRDIAPGEELTDDYGMFNIDSDMLCRCRSHNCRRVISGDDFTKCRHRWDERIQQVLRRPLQPPQPLLPYLDPEIRSGFTVYLATGRGYISVSALACTPAGRTGIAPGERVLERAATSAG